MANEYNVNYNKGNNNVWIVWLYTNFQNHVVVCKEQQAVGSSL